MLVKSERWSVGQGVKRRHLSYWLCITSWQTWNGTYLPVLEIYEHLPYISITDWFASTRCNTLVSHPVLALPISYFCPVVLFFPLSFVLMLCSSIHRQLVPRPSGTWAGRPQTLGVIWASCGIWSHWQNKQMNVRWNDYYMQLAPVLMHLLASSTG